MNCYQPFYLRKQNIIIACGKCLNCQSNKKKEYAWRTSVELEKYKNKHFITLTYTEQDLPRTENGEGSLKKEHLTNYIKNLRIKQERDYRLCEEKAEIKYFSAGEYSPELERPHYHIVLGSNRNIKYNAMTLWKYGNAKVENLISMKGVSYAVGYTQKKQWEQKYLFKEEPFHKFSAGIGKDWFEEKWREGKITAEKYFIDTQNYKIGIGSYYKYLLRKKYYDYDMDFITKESGKLKWEALQREIQEAIEKANKDRNEETFKEQLLRENTSIYKLNKNIILHEKEILKTWRNKLEYYNYVRDMCMAERNNKARKQLKYEAEAKFWMRTQKRDKVA